MRATRVPRNKRGGNWGNTFGKPIGKKRHNSKHMKEEKKGRKRGVGHFKEGKKSSNGTYIKTQNSDCE